jgi:hypothetical protein
MSGSLMLLCVHVFQQVRCLGGTIISGVPAKADPPAPQSPQHLAHSIWEALHRQSAALRAEGRHRLWQLVHDVQEAVRPHRRSQHRPAGTGGGRALLLEPHQRKQPCERPHPDVCAVPERALSAAPVLVGGECPVGVSRLLAGS